jgi:hypothetical protein
MPRQGRKPDPEILDADFVELNPPATGREPIFGPGLLPFAIVLLMIVLAGLAKRFLLG